MKPWGLSGRGALLAVLLLVLSGVVIPLGARAQANVVSGTVTDCASLDPVGARVFLVDVHAPASERNTQAPAGSGYFTFANVQPSYYKLRVQPDGSTHFRTETAPFRVDGITEVTPKRVCVDKMPDKTRTLEVTVVDGATNSANETVTFQQFDRVDENVTARGISGYDYPSDNVSLVTRPLGWNSEILTYSDNTTPIGGITLARGTGPTAHYDYTEVDAYNGIIHVSNTTIQTKLENTLFGRPDRGYLEITYKNVSKSSQLSNGQISNPTFFKNGNPIIPYNSTVQLNTETGSLLLDRSDWRYGSSGDVLSASYSWSGAISGADVTVRFAPRDQAISDTINTPPSGKAVFSVWDNAGFEVKVEAAGYLTALVTVNVSGSSVNLQVPLIRGYKVRAYAWEGNQAVTTAEGLTGALINTDWTVNKEIQVLKPVVVDNLLTFNAYNGSWRLIADANGRKAVTRPVVVNGSNVFITPDIDFQKSLEEPIRTEINFAANTDWNNITVWRNFTLLSDSVFPGLEFPEVRDIHWQLDLNFGNRDGNLTPGELDDFRQHLQDNGPFYVVTDNLITVNGKAYNSTAYVVSPPVDAGSTGNISVSTRADFTLKQIATGALPANKPRYFVNLTTIADKNVTVYQNYSYRVLVPRGYEMTSKTTTGNVVIRDFVAITVDPGIDAVVPNPKANLVIDQSLTGVARAEVEGPAGKVFVKDPEQDKYLAWVANNTAIVFSANKTSDRQNQAVNAKEATFEWTFRYQSNSTLKGTATGIWTTFDLGSLGTNYSVNLTVTQVNPDNRTYRVINVTVDNINPIARVLTSRTTGENPVALTVKEDLVTTFNGGNSTDLLWGTLKGEIAEWNWDFDSDGTADRTGKVVTFNYSTPGSFTANLTVVDRVGHKSANQTLEVTVLDTTPPVPNLSIVDENNTWREVTQLTEKKGYWFNVSQTTDNSLNRTEDNVNLTYTFNWGDVGPSNKTGPFLPSANGTLYINVSKTYTTHGEFKLSINVTDRAGNVGWLNRTLIVQANTTAHPDLSIVAGTLKITPSSPEEGQLATFSFRIENAAGRANATSLRFQLAVLSGGTFGNQSAKDVRFLNPDGTATTFVGTGKNATVEFKWAFDTLGNKTFKITIWDDDEPKNAIGSANEITSNLIVREAGWKIWAWVGAFLFIIIGLPTIYYVIRKVRAGELHLPRRRREEGGEEEEEEEEDEEDEDEADDRKVAEDRKKRL